MTMKYAIVSTAPWHYGTDRADWNFWGARCQLFLICRQPYPNNWRSRNRSEANTRWSPKKQLRCWIRKGSYKPDPQTRLVCLQAHFSLTDQTRKSECRQKNLASQRLVFFNLSKEFLTLLYRSRNNFGEIRQIKSNAQQIFCFGFPSLGIHKIADRVERVKWDPNRKNNIQSEGIFPK